jgi:hypothetical protein
MERCLRKTCHLGSRAALRNLTKMESFRMMESQYPLQRGYLICLWVKLAPILLTLMVRFTIPSFTRTSPYKSFCYRSRRIRTVGNAVDKYTSNHPFFVINARCRRRSRHAGTWIPRIGPVHRSIVVLDWYYAGRCVVYGCFRWVGRERCFV